MSDEEHFKFSVSVEEETVVAVVSVVEETSREAEKGRDIASATMFWGPGTYRRSDVNSAMKESCLCCLEVQGGESLERAEQRGL